MLEARDARNSNMPVLQSYVAIVTQSALIDLIIINEDLIVCQLGNERQLPLINRHPPLQVKCFVYEDQFIAICIVWQQWVVYGYK